MSGVGLWVWRLGAVAGGVASVAADETRKHAPGRVLIKVSDGKHPFKGNAGRSKAYLAGLPGVEPCAWSYVYDAADPQGQARALLDGAASIGAQRLYVNAEVEFATGDATADEKAMRAILEALRAEWAGPIYLSSFKFPTNFPGFPWHVLTDYNVGGAPQVYGWGAGDSASYQTALAIAEWRAFSPLVLPTLGAFHSEKPPMHHSPTAVLAAGVSVLACVARGWSEKELDLWSLEHMKPSAVFSWHSVSSRLGAMLQSPVTKSVKPLSLETPWWQKAALLRLGKFSGPLSGGWTGPARKALKSYQADSAELKADGVWGPRTAAYVAADLAGRLLP